MSVVSNLKWMKRCTAELTDAKLRTVYTCTIHSSHLYSSHMYLFNAAVPVEDETEQSRWTQHRGHTQFDWMAYPFGVRCLFWHWKQFCFLPGYLETACETGSDAVIPSIDTDWAGTLCLTDLPADKARRTSSRKLMCFMIFGCPCCFWVSLKTM